ncbi:hypothetical protein Agabi119p4_9586 [Agaricus bisporus var. burnettii]|uniref:Uncharacterized protein n=1 Tax=Agaricus bisporus var. burnettii TaxID=192524 RepID=A0A8H7C2P8_AGABI|nr:hypothetical protein Agabi119p4_9586 [Agaricus bisporus var. burnettii]
MGIPLDKAELLALFLECIIYGIFLTFFVILVVISFAKDPIRVANQRFVLPIATIMMILAITHLVLDFTRMMQAFVTGDETRLPNPIGYYGNIANSLHVVKTVIYVLQTILGDGVLIWRCYIINNRSLYVIIPATVALFANLAIGLVVAWSMSKAVPGIDIFQTASHFIESFFIITMGLNFCCTVAIVARIWETRRSVASISGRSLYPVMAVIIESGAIYTASVLCLLVSYLVNSNGQYPALDLITPLVGVVFCLIVLQIHFHLKLSSPAGTATNNPALTQGWRCTAGQSSYQLRSGVSVHITEHAEVYADTESDVTKHKGRLDDM